MSRFVRVAREKLHEMSTEVRRELKFIPPQVNVVEHIRYVYGCRRCEQEAISTPIVTSPMPTPVVPGSLVSPSMMAYDYEPEVRGQPAAIPAGAAVPAFGR